ncbi:MAG TPA: UDP-glucose 4-epimerase GalE [Terriglobales bacterium]|nr:UDP-glucose 4-epimerase GalE [Terriglobales bacterium]
MRVLVTGGAGYIGSHAARALAQRGHKVVLYDNLSTGHRSLAGNLELLVGDVGDQARLREVLSRTDAVMHFAAHAYVGESVQNPRKYFDNNARSGLALLNAMLDAGVAYFVFSSTCAVYGVPSKVPIPEDTPRLPVNPYGASKLFVEHALEAYSQAHGLRFAALRYFNAAGADESGEIGELHSPETHLIPSILEAVSGLRPELQVYGNDYPTPDGTCVRDYIHVNDLAEAHVAALEYLAEGGPSMALNLGTGHGHSVREVISMVERVTGQKVPQRVCARRPGDPPILVADATRAQQVLHWKPRRSLEHIVDTAWRWMQSCLQKSAATPMGTHG